MKVIRSYKENTPTKVTVSEEQQMVKNNEVVVSNYYYKNKENQICTQ